MVSVHGRAVDLPVLELTAFRLGRVICNLRTGIGQTAHGRQGFTAMVLFNSIRDPLSTFPDAIQTFFQARISLDRMAKYLNAEEVHPERVARDAENYAADVVIAMEGAGFKWTKPKLSANDLDGERMLGSEPPPLLRDVNFQIKKGDFVVIHGAVSAGKSLLCAALLGELPRDEGKVFVRTPNVAYYSQQPWIQNMTIRDNILFGLPFEKTKYDRVIDASGLVKDLTMLPAGDATEIGQKGVNLSGGQKARVSRARVCYADADVYILDSPLAAVDALVQSEIFNKCLCGLLKKKTVVLVTHLHDIIESKAVNVRILVEYGEAKVTCGDRNKTRRV